MSISNIYQNYVIYVYVLYIKYKFIVPYYFMFTSYVVSLVTGDVILYNRFGESENGASLRTDCGRQGHSVTLLNHLYY